MKCGNCSKAVNLLTEDKCMCKCGQIIYCSKPCFLTGIQTHKQACPVAILRKQRNAFVGPKRPVRVQPEPDHTPSPLPTASGLHAYRGIPSLGGAENGSGSNETAVYEEGSADHINGNTATTGLPAVSHHGQPPDTRHRVLNNLSSPTVSLPADQAPGLGGDTSQGISTMPHPVSQSRPRQDSAQVGRDKHGRFVPSTLGPKPPISETQKIANQKASHYKKLKDSVVVIMKKIQQLRPDVSQQYTIESNKKNTMKDPLIYGTFGEALKPGESRAGNTCTDTDIEEVSDQESMDEADLEPFDEGECVEESEPKNKNRWAQMTCYICKNRLGPKHYLRIVCCIKNCHTSPAHIACLNMRPPARMLPFLRNIYRCPKHSGTIEEDENELQGSPAKEPNLDAFVKSKLDRKKNCNFDKPKKLSPLLMTVLQTDQKYQSSNEIRALLRSYIERRKLKVDKGYVYPDSHLYSVVAKDGPFRSQQFISLLKATKNVQD